MSALAYDCIIATKNRISALRMSIPLILKQDLPPSRLIVVDASDDHKAVKAEVGAIARAHDHAAMVVMADRPNLARQRNLGLQLAQSPIVMFPDDDSMWCAGFARNIMDVYRSDTRGQIGAVGGNPVTAPPPELPLTRSYKPSRMGMAKQMIGPVRFALERRLAPKPFHRISSSTWADKIEDMDEHMERVAYVTGFRMSFRAAIIKEIGFDETLGYGSGYCYHEDVDACLRLNNLGYAVVSTGRANVCHLSFPGRRGDDYDYGFFSIANCSYVCKKSMGADPIAMKIMERYLKYKLLLYATKSHSSRGRQMFLGALCAWRNRAKLLRAEEPRIALEYRDLCRFYHATHADDHLLSPLAAVSALGLPK